MPRGSAEKRSTPSGAHVTLPRGKGSMSKAAVRGGAAAWQFLRCACQASADLASTVLLERDKYSALGGGLLGGATMWTGALATLAQRLTRRASKEVITVPLRFLFSDRSMLRATETRQRPPSPACPPPTPLPAVLIGARPARVGWLQEDGGESEEDSDE